MTNPHIIVGEPRRCLCGMYGGQPTSCADILADPELAARVLTSLLQDCDDAVPRNTTDRVANLRDPVRDSRNSEEP